MSTYLSINGRELDVTMALQLDILHENKLYNQMVENLLVQEYCAKNGISNTDEELQVAADELRYDRGLESVDETKYWMKNNNLTLLGIQEGINYMLLRNKMRNSFSDDELQAFYNDNKTNYERVNLYSIRLESEEKAQELFAQINEDELCFFEAAIEHSEDILTNKAAGFVGEMGRNDVTGEIEAAVFNAEEGEVVGPMKTEKGFNIFRVGKKIDNSFEAVKDRVQIDYMMNVLNKLKAEANIQVPILATNGEEE